MTHRQIDTHADRAPPTDASTTDAVSPGGGVVGLAGPVSGGGQPELSLQSRADYETALKHAMRMGPDGSRDRPPSRSPSVAVPPPHPSASHTRGVFVSTPHPLLSFAFTLCEMEALAETWGCRGNLP